MINMMNWEKFGLKENPFSIVPANNSVDLWADRKKAKNIFEKKINTFNFNSISDVLLIWGDFGAGKTHSLYYFQNQINKSQKGFCIFTDITQIQPTSFQDLFVSFIRAIDIDIFHEIVSDVFSNNKQENKEKAKKIAACNWSELKNVIYSLQDEENYDIAFDWMQGNNLLIQDKKRLGVTNKIKSKDDQSFLAIFKALVNLCKEANRFLVWMLDEYQTLRDIHSRQLDRLKLSLLNIYNNSPKGLVLGFAFSSRQRDVVTRLLPEGLLARLGESPYIEIPTLSKEEGLEYVKDLINYYKIEDKNIDDFYPLTEDFINKMLSIMINEYKDDLIPRLINIRFQSIITKLYDKGIKPPYNSNHLLKLSNY